MKSYKTIQVNKKQVRLHRYLMEQKMGRKLLFSEVVHHIDHDIFNNDINNLQLVSRSEHKKLHNEVGLLTRFKRKYYLDVNEIAEMYKTMGALEISIHLKVSKWTIYHIMKKNDIKRRPSFNTAKKIIKK